MSETKLLIRAGEAALMLSISRTTLWRRVKDGSVPSIKIGGCRLFDVDELRELIREK